MSESKAASAELVVNVADLVHRPGARRHERLSSPLGEIRVVDVSIPAGAEVVVDVMLEWVSDGILVTGTVEAPWQADCRRCLEPVKGETTVKVRELFEERFHEGETYPLRHDTVDLGMLAREALLLELPWAPVCAEDCRGLCPDCGADLNRGECRCRPSWRDERWAGLDALGGEGD